MTNYYNLEVVCLLRKYSHVTHWILNISQENFDFCGRNKFRGASIPLSESKLSYNFKLLNSKKD